MKPMRNQWAGWVTMSSSAL